MAADDYLKLCRAIAGDRTGLVLVDDMLVGDSPISPAYLPVWSGRPTRFAAGLRVCDEQGQPVGVLVLADPQCRAGLSTAKTYVLKAQAAQLADNLAYQIIKDKDAIGEAKVTERLRLLESVVVNAKDAILITEAEPTCLPGPRIVYCNAAFIRTTGYSEEEVLGKTPRILQGEGTDPLSRALIRDSLSKWKPIEIEMLNYKKDGEPFWVELSIVP